MSWRLVLAACALATSLSLGGCARGDADTATTATAATTLPVTISGPGGTPLK